MCYKKYGYDKIATYQCEISSKVSTYRNQDAQIKKNMQNINLLTTRKMYIFEEDEMK